MPIVNATHSRVAACTSTRTTSTSTPTRTRPTPASARRRRSTTTSATTSGRCRATPTSRRRCVNWQTFSNTRSDILDIIKAGVELPPGVILFEDPPLHTMHRGLMSRVFTPRRDGRARGPGPRVLRPLPRPARRLRRLRHHHRARARCCRCGSSACCSASPKQDQVAVRNKTDANLRTEPGKPMDVQGGGGRQRRHVRRLHRVAGQAPLRRPHDPAAQRRVRGRARRDADADPPGGPHLHRGARRRRQRDHRPAHRLAGQGARRAPRPAARGRRGPLAASRT